MPVHGPPSPGFLNKGSARNGRKNAFTTTAMAAMAASSGDCQALCQPASTRTPTEPVSREPTSFMILPPELRQKIYNYTFRPGFSYSRSTHGEGSTLGKLWVHIRQGIPIPLLLTSKHLYQEVSQYYWSTTTFLINTQWYESPKEYTDSQCAQMKHLQDIFTPVCKLPVQLWETRLLFGWIIPITDYDYGYDYYDEWGNEQKRLLHDALLWMLSKQTATIRHLQLIIPCLCSRAYGWERSERLTPETWSSNFVPILQPLLSQLRIEGTLTFVPTCQESFPPCPLKKCKALVDYLKDVKSIVEGDSPVTTECPTEKWRCDFWHMLNAAEINASENNAPEINAPKNNAPKNKDSHPVDCGCKEVIRVEHSRAKVAKPQKIKPKQQKKQRNRHQ
ncbi:MAG: hypothetical protein Q9208_004326 [Pyrenodesmia sp. 3 TL-2023]